MPATPARIGFIQEPFRRVVAETAAIKTRFGDLARESEDPVETFFDNEADAQVIATARQSLLGTERRRFQVRTKGIEDVLALNFGGDVPIAHYVDTERGVDRNMLLSEVVMDLGRGTATLTVWG